MAFSTVTPAQLGQAAITTSVATIYTVPALTRTFVKDLDICNTTGAAINVRVYLVPSAGIAAASNALMYDVPIPANTTVQWTGSQILHVGASIQVSASGLGVTVTASGGEAT